MLIVFSFVALFIGLHEPWINSGFIVFGSDIIWIGACLLAGLLFFALGITNIFSRPKSKDAIISNPVELQKQKFFKKVVGILAVIVLVILLDLFYQIGFFRAF